MAKVRTHLLDDIQYLGGIFQEIENAYVAIDYEEDLAAFLPVLRSDHGEMFAGEHDSSGQAWAELAPATIQAKGHERILWEFGHLEESLVSDGGGDQIAETYDRGLIFGTSDKKAKWHQVGTANMPARPPVGLKEETLGKIVDSVADKTVESLKG